MAQEVVVQKVADTAAAGSSFLAGAVWIADLAPILTVAATLVAIVAGAGAAWFHIEGALCRRKIRLKGSKK